MLRLWSHTLLIAAATSSASVLLGQGVDGYGDFPQEVQSTNVPAGIANEPGSQLIFLLDTGVRPADLFGSFDGSLTIYELSGGTITGSLFTNFISVTNSNTRDAVTLHFRYFNHHCDDVLDFLVVLTCNDTMLIDPFNYTIPATPYNTRDRFFGQFSNFPLPPMSAAELGDGRFLLMVTAAGAAGNDSGIAGDTSTFNDRLDFDDPEDLDPYADWLFPKELVADARRLALHCPDVDRDRVGVEEGTSDHNLNVFNASAISFNYLTGFHTVGVARAGGQASYGVTAWVRPAVNLSGDLDPEDSSETPDVFDSSPQDVVGEVPTPVLPDPPKEPNTLFDFFDLYNLVDGGLDGDGPLAPRGVILSGSEEIWLSLRRRFSPRLPANYYYLRQDAHGGNTIETNCQGMTPSQTRCDPPDDWEPQPVVGGAMNWTLFPTAGVAAADQQLFMLSIKDDYNGSNNPPSFISIKDNAYSMDPAATYYQLTVFNNDEGLFILPDPEIPISPTPPFIPVSITIAVRCFDAFRFAVFGVADVQVPGGSQIDFAFTENFGDFSLQDLFSLDGKGLVADFLSEPAQVNSELGPGWIRVDRAFTRDYWYDLTELGTLHSFAVPYDGERGTYVTIAKNILFAEAFGVSWYLPQAATDFEMFP